MQFCEKKTGKSIENKLMQTFSFKTLLFRCFQYGVTNNGYREKTLATLRVGSGRVEKFSGIFCLSTKIFTRRECKG